MTDRGTLGGFTREEDYLDHSAEPPEFKSSGLDNWYYVVNGEKRGPVSAILIKDLLNKNEIAADTHVWRKGMKDWCTIRDSELYSFVDSVPPALSPHLIGNGYVWVLAFLPLVLGLINASIDSYNQDQVAGFWSLGFTPHVISDDVAWRIYGPLNGLFALLDFLRLKKAGYGTLWRALLALFIPVIYLFLRARLLKQRPSYAIVWIVMFVIGVLLD